MTNIAAQNAYITQEASRLGLDPRAVAGIESHEGGSGGIGDQGTSFGPFQLHEGGALPSGLSGQQAQQWAWSNAGINYALKAMAKDGAAGLKGRAAITAISTKFERPADPASEIAAAMSYYQSHGQLSPVKAGQGFGGGKGVATGAGVSFDSATYQKQASALLMQQAQAQANGGVDPSTGQPPPSLVTSLEAARQAATVKITSGGPGVLSKGTKINLTGNSIGAQAAKMALKQVGQPYVWGGENPKGKAGGPGGAFDCSGLVQWAYGALGIKLPRVAVDQGKMGKAVNYSGGGGGGNLKPGDLIVEKNGDHIVMYIGNGKVVQAPHTGQNVQVSPLSWFPPSQYNARRIAA